jgi:hypothetical protein
MTETVRVISKSGLRLRDSPRDGATVKVLPNNETVEVLGRETWLRVRHKGQIGFVLADHVEPASGSVTLDAVVPAAGAARYTGAVKIIRYTAATVFRGEALMIDEEFLPDLRKIEVAAAKQELVVWITSSWREPKKPVNNAIVPAAQLSNHLVGHGIDMNLIHKGEFFNSAALMKATLPQEITDFFSEIRAKPHPLRWGIEFSPADPVHIDNGLNVFHQSVYRQKLEKLWG